MPLSPEEQAAVEAEAQKMREKAVTSVVNAEPAQGWAGEFIDMEISGLVVDHGMGEDFVAGTVTLSRESALAAMYSLGKSLGSPGATAEFLAEQFGWEG